MPKNGRGASGVRGVYRTQYSSKPWGAKISVRGRAVYLGIYATTAEAEEALRLGREKHGLDLDRRTRTVINRPIPYRSIASTLKEMLPDVYDQVLAEVTARQTAARDLDTPPEPLPEGWDLV